jgi:hypothetical protein
MSQISTARSLDLLLVKLLERRAHALGCVVLELGDAQITDIFLQNPMKHALDLDLLALERELKRLVDPLAPDCDVHGRARRAGQFLDGVAKGQILGRFSLDFDNPVP